MHKPIWLFEVFEFTLQFHSFRRGYYISISIKRFRGGLLSSFRSSRLAHDAQGGGGELISFHSSFTQESFELHNFGLQLTALGTLAYAIILNSWFHLLLRKKLVFYVTLGLFLNAAVVAMTCEAAGLVVIEDVVADDVVAQDVVAEDVVVVLVGRVVAILAQDLVSDLNGLLR